MDSFAIPTLDEQHEFALALSVALLTNPDISQGSFGWLWFKTLAGCVTDNHAHISSVYNDLLPDTAADDTLVRWGNITGKTQKGATPSNGATALRVFGSSGTIIPDQSQLQYGTTGLLFATNGAQTIASTGYVDISIVAISTGSATNLSAGSQLTFTNTPAGANDVAVLQIDLTDGADLETDGAYRLRILSQISSPAAGGRQDDYVQWALDQLGIATAFCYPIRQGLGSVDVAALHLGSGTDRLLLSGEVTTLQTVLDSLIPVGVTFRVLTVFATAEDIEYTYIPDGGATTVPDWNDASPPTVSAWTAGTRTLELSALPPDLAPGGRIVIATSSADGGTGEVSTVESIGSGTNIVLEAAPSFTPQAADVVYAGGPLTQSIRAAIQTLVDSLGTANPDATRYGAWEGNLDPGSIDASSRDVTGVLRGTVVSPSELIEAEDPAYPDDGTIELLIAGRILVRAQH